MALAESLLTDAPIGRAAVQAYDKAKAYTPDADEAKMIDAAQKQDDMINHSARRFRLPTPKAIR